MRLRDQKLAEPKPAPFPLCSDEKNRQSIETSSQPLGTQKVQPRGRKILRTTSGRLRKQAEKTDILWSFTLSQTTGQ